MAGRRSVVLRTLDCHRPTARVDRLRGRRCGWRRSDHELPISRPKLEREPARLDDPQFRRRFREPEPPGPLAGNRVVRRNADPRCGAGWKSKARRFAVPAGRLSSGSGVHLRRQSVSGPNNAAPRRVAARSPVPLRRDDNPRRRSRGIDVAADDRRVRHTCSLQAAADRLGASIRALTPEGAMTRVVKARRRSPDPDR